MARRRSSWFGLSADAWSAGIEAQQVIALRMAKMALGGEAAHREAERMVSEKTTTALQVQAAAASALMSGAGAAIPARTVATYRRKMRANRRRLLKEFGV